MGYDAAVPLRVGLLPERIGNTLSPCASIRLHAFLNYLAHAGLVRYRALLMPEVRRYQPDVVLWHRGSISDASDLDVLLALRKAHGTQLVYDIDDNLLDMDDHGERGAYAHLQTAVRRSLAIADEVWCSTPALAARVGRECAAITHTVSNALDPALWRLRSPQADRVDTSPYRLLYMGTRTHDADFEILANAMDLLESRDPGAVQLTVIGVRGHDREDRPWLQVRSVPDFVGASYPGFVHWLNNQEGFDAGVAPLVDSDFNACKSNIKVLDYAAMGLPTIASDVPAYAHALRHDQDCILTGNEPAQWAEAISRLATDPASRARLAEVLPRLVSPERFIEGARARYHSLNRLLQAA